MAIIDVVKMDFAPGVFARKFPGQELSAKTQLIVSESQEAVFLKEGKAYGPFGPGRHVLDARNYPILTSLMKIVTGSSPFTAEVWFIQRAFSLDIKWGTSGAIQIEDPKYHIMLPVRSFGQYGVQIVDSCKFLVKLVGTLPAFTEKTLCEYFRGVIVTRVKDLIGEYMVDKQVSVFQLAARLNDISKTIEQEVSAEFEEFGVRVIKFNVNSITTDENDPAVKKLREALATRAEMDIVGYNYQQKRSFDTIETAAGNKGAGGIMNAGLGLGMGVGLGAPMGGMMGQMAGNLQTAPGVRCAKCGKTMPAGAKFCSECGAPTAPAAPAAAKCAKCGATLVPGAKFCPECGAPTAAKCPGCGKELPGGMKFCPECGTKID